LRAWSTLFGMPWKETCAMSERVRLVDLVLSEGIPIGEAATLLGVSRKTAYKWLSRFRTEGGPGLVDRSRARLTQPHAVCPAVRGLFISLREETGEGPRKLLWLARRRHPGLELPSVSTVASILKAADLVPARARPRRDPELRGPTGPYRAGERPNEQWTIDFKGEFRLGDRSMCYPLTVQDDASRYVLCADAYGSTSGEGVSRSMTRLFRAYGLPERIHSDNGSPFASSGIGRLSRVSVEWMRQGIEVCRSRPGEPQDNPRHERMHRTLKERTARPPASTRAGQQRRFGEFRRWMNDERGHEGLGMRAPAEVYARSDRAWNPRPGEPEYPGHWEVRRVRSTGELKLKGGPVFVSEALSGELVGLEEVSDDVWRLSYRRSVLCFVDLRGARPRLMREAEADRG
jgi:transposase InsO family protein